jgi:hypothetical protein
MQQISLVFLLDENQFGTAIPRIVGSRGHVVRNVRPEEDDQRILARAEDLAALVVTADRWFVQELFRLPSNHRRNRFRRAGVVQVPGTAKIAALRLEEFLPVIEAVCHICGSRIDQRIGIELRESTVFIHG